MTPLRISLRLGLSFGALILAGPILAASLDLNPEELRGDTTKKQVMVLENRYFSKQMRPELGLALGVMLNEAYTSTIANGVHAAIFPQEWIGVEFQYFKTTVSDSADRKSLRKQKFWKIGTNEQVYPDTETNRIRSITDINAVIAPFYGKLNFVNLAILYSDLYITGGITNVMTDQGGKTGITLGFGQRFYFKKALCVRIDYRDRMYKENRSIGEVKKNSHAVDLGMSYFFL